MAGDGCNGNGAAAGVVVPEIKFTKLFINGEFVDAVSGTSIYMYIYIYITYGAHARRRAFLSQTRRRSG
jgi:hypothetical protein